MIQQRPLVRFAMALVICSGLLAACGGGANLLPTTAAPRAAGGTATPAPLRAAASPVDCNAVTAAWVDFGHSLVKLMALAPDSNYSVITDPASYFYLDFVKLRADLDTLATLPDAADATLGRKVSDTIPRLRRQVDRAERNVKAGGNPFDDGSADGQGSSGPDSPLFTDFSAVSNASIKAC
jgi:hypothetical protein